MSRLFRYNVVTLINLVNQRPCLWDKSVDSFKDRTERQLAWNEIYVELEPGFLDKDKKEQRLIGEIINGKWQNVRDSFVKSLKKNSRHRSSRPSRRYIYHQHLQFLMKVVPKAESDEEVDSEEEEIGTDKKSNNNLSKKPRLFEDIDRDIDKELVEALRSNKSEPDEDEAFFISITPSVKKMSDQDKLEFRMGVLQLIKNINNSSNRNTSESKLFYRDDSSPNS